MNQEVKEVNPSVAYEKIQNGAILMDIREGEEIEMLAFDVEGQILIPQSEFANRFREIPTDKEIIVGCNSGSRSLNISRFLMEQEFDTIYNLKGGITDWLERGFPVKWDTYKTEKAVQANEF